MIYLKYSFFHLLKNNIPILKTIDYKLIMTNLIDIFLYIY